MAYKPDTTIRLYKGVPFDETNVLYFGKGAPQSEYLSWLYNYIVGSSNILANNLSYQRENTYIRIGVENDANQYYDLNLINYVTFTNPHHSSRVIFAFVTSVEYVNEHCADIYFEIDYWHTFVDTLDLLGGWIERCHYSEELSQLSNPIGRRALRIEHIDVGEYVCYDRTTVEMINPHYVVKSYLNSDDGKIRYPFYSQGIQSSLPQPTIFSTPYLSELNNFIDVFSTHPEAIFDIYMTWDAPEPYIHIKYPPDFPADTQMKNPWSKLFKFPSMYIRVTNTMGRERAFYAEQFFSNIPNMMAETIRFRVLSNGDNDVPMRILCPVDYKGIDQTDITEGVMIDEFPHLVWSSATYNQWLNANGGNVAMKTAGSLLPLVAGIATAGSGGALAPLLALGGTAVSLGSISANVNAQYKQGDAIEGKQSYGGMLAYFTGSKAPRWYIDIMGAYPGLMASNNAYFNGYGYLSGWVGKPDIGRMPYFDYLKGDINVKVEGNIMAARVIRRMFAQGVRAWHKTITPSNFGNLELDNRN